MLDSIIVPELDNFTELSLDPNQDNPFGYGYDPFAINVGGTVTANGGLNTEGIVLDLGDDARIFTQEGFDFNGENLILPVLRDSNGDALLDPEGKLTLLEDAVVVGPNFLLAEATTDAYNNLLPPETQIGEDKVITVPSWAEVKEYELAHSVPENPTEVELDPKTTPLKNAAQWSANFPSGTADNPIVVRVKEGSLTVPKDVTLSHTIVIVEQGDIEFKANGQVLSDVVLVAEQGSVDLAQVEATNLRVLAGNALTMQGGARFGGDTLLASGSGGLTFNGATKTREGEDFVTAVSDSPLTYNGASDTRGRLLSQGDMTFNGNSSLLGTIKTEANLIFNGQATVTDINRAPFIDSEGSVTVEENTVGTFYTGIGVDPNRGDRLTWSLAGADQEFFTIDPETGAIAFQEAPNYEQPVDGDLNNVYELLLTVSDPDGLSYTKPLTITVSNITVTDPDTEPDFLNNIVTVNDERFEVGI